MRYRAGDSKVDASVRALKEQIVTGKWAVNSKIPREPELMELLGVGKSTVREAVRSLSAVGMLEPIKGIGTFVRSRTPVNEVVRQYLAGFGYEDLLGLRASLEIEAAQLAAKHRTEAQLRALRAAHERDIAKDSAAAEVVADLDARSPDARSAWSALPGTEFGHSPGSFHHGVFEASGNALLAALYANVMSVIRPLVSDGVLVHGSAAQARRQDHGDLLQAIERRDVAAAAHLMAAHVARDLVVAGTSQPEPAEQSADHLLH